MPLVGRLNVSPILALLLILSLSTSAMAQFRTAPSGGTPKQSTLNRYVNRYPSEAVRGVALLTLIQKQFVTMFGLEKWTKLGAYATEQPITVEESDALGNKLKVFRCLPHNCAAENSVLYVNLEDGDIFLVCFYKEIYEPRTKTTFADIEFISDVWFLHTRFPKGSYNAGGDAKAHYTNCDDGWGEVYSDIFGAE
jgi:hypothetical protein